MFDDNATAKSCGQKLLTNSEPSHNWTVGELSNFAKQQYAGILTHERFAAPFYWRPGHCLTLTRKLFAHGQWQSHLSSLGIDKSRAAKACAIYRSFENAGAVESLTVEEAYAARRKNNSTDLGNSHGTDAQRVVAPTQPIKALGEMEKRAAAVEALLTHATQTEKRDILTQLRHLISMLQRQVAALEAELKCDGEALAG